LSYSHRPSGQPRVIGLTMVKNEQDIIEPMLRHNAALLDALIVLDNGSVDDTRTIALALARELGNVVVTDSAKFGYTQGERMTRLLHAAQSAYFADFVLFLDADEFIGATNRTTFHAELAKIPPGGFGAIAWRNFVLTDDTPIADPPNGLTHRRVAEALPVYKTVLRLDGVFQPDLVVGRGSHAVTRLGTPLSGVILPDLPLWHFPIRGHAQLTAKALVGWLACLAANPRAAETSESYHWRGMYQRIVDGPGFNPADLRTLSLHYADPSYAFGLSQPPDPPTIHDPPPIETMRRHSTGAFLDPLTLVARSWDQTLRAQDPLFAPAEVSDAAIDIPPFRFLVEKHQPASVLDIGCGTGLNLELCARLGVQDLAGVGPLPRDALILRQGGYVTHDPAVAFTFGRQYALVLCLNTAANQSPDEAAALVANADRHAESTIVFCLDNPTAEHLQAWLARWQALGWAPDLRETQALRCLSSCAGLRRGLVVLHHAEDASDETKELLAIARRPFRVPPSSPGIHQEPLLDAAEISWLGYAA
jgi:SAM-dependent methyltransferase